MGVIGAREALSGPWAFNVSGWFVLFLPCTLLVVLLNSATPFPHFGFVMVSAIVQHLAIGVFYLGAAWWRHGGHQLSVWSTFALWSGIGIVRGLIGGAIASAVTETDAGFPLRITVWLLMSWVWMPLFTYTAAQGQHRRLLLGELDRAIVQRDSARRRKQRTAEDIRKQLVHAIQTSVTPVIEDIQSSLAATRFSLDSRQLRLLGERLASISRQLGGAVHQLTATTAEAHRDGPGAGAPLISAFTFERRKPWLSSALSAAVLATVLVPLCLEFKGAAFLGHFTLAMSAAALALVAASRIVPTGLDEFRRQVAWVVARYGTAGLSAGLVLAVLRWHDLDRFTTLIIVILPGAIAFAAIVVSGTVGLAAANRQAIRSIHEVEADRAEAEAAAAAEENAIREQLEQLMHGPVLGRLAACAMALNFHAAVVGTVPTDRTTHVVNAVAGHLDAATADLNALTS